MADVLTHQYLSRDLRPDPASVHVQFAGNLADDDFMWIVECTIEEFHKMLTSPVAWVKNLSTLPDWHYVGSRKPAPAPLLLKHFTMRIQQREKDAPSDLVTIQGISSTGIITVRASKASAVMGVRSLSTFREDYAEVSFDDDAGFPAETLSSFWDQIAYDPTNAPTFKKQYAVNVDVLDSRYYGHFEICQPGYSSPEERLALTAAFILALGSDPQGYVDMLNGLDQKALYITESGVREGQPIKMSLPANITTGPQILYTSLDEATEAACSMLDGVFEIVRDGLPIGIFDNPIVKKYGVDEDAGNPEVPDDSELLLTD